MAKEANALLKKLAPLVLRGFAESEAIQKVKNLQGFLWITKENC